MKGIRLGSESMQCLQPTFVREPSTKLIDFMTSPITRVVDVNKNYNGRVVGTVLSSVESEDLGVNLFANGKSTCGQELLLNFRVRVLRDGSCIRHPCFRGRQEFDRILELFNFPPRVCTRWIQGGNQDNATSYFNNVQTLGKIQAAQNTPTGKWLNAFGYVPLHIDEGFFGEHARAIWTR